MKRKESTEPDLYVVNRKITDKELQELRDFIKNYKRKRALKKSKSKAKTAA